MKKMISVLIWLIAGTVGLLGRLFVLFFGGGNSDSSERPYVNFDNPEVLICI
jgi:hypothetical protein